MANQLIDPTAVGNGNGLGQADLALVRGQALQQVKASYATAVVVQKPRELAVVQRRLLEEARLAGEDFYYGWGVGKDAIEGPSVKLAMSAARCWGNCAIEALPIQEMADAWIFTAAFIDLETGFTLTRQFRQSKSWIVYGKMDDERKGDVRFQIGQSKAARNCVLNALPAGLVDRAMAEAKSGVRAKIEEFVNAKGIAAATDLVLKALLKHGVKEEAVLARAGVADRRGLDVEHIVLLKGDLHAIESGQERAEALFPVQVQAKAEEVSSRIKAPKKAKDEGPVQMAVAEPGSLADTLKIAPTTVPEEGGSLADLLDDIRQAIDDAKSRKELEDTAGKLLARNKAQMGEQPYNLAMSIFQIKYKELPE